MRRTHAVILVIGFVIGSLGCAGLEHGAMPSNAPPPLTATAALGQRDAARDGSLRLVIEGLDEDAEGRPSRALGKYQRAIRVDPTNPFAYLALSRHHLEAQATDEASAFLDQARAFFEAEDELGPAVDVWGFGLRAGIARARGNDEQADRLFVEARRLAPDVWQDERLSAWELR